MIWLLKVYKIVGEIKWRGEDTKIFCVFVHSPDANSIQECARAKPGAKSSIRISQVGWQRPRFLGQPPRYNSRKLDYKWRQDWPSVNIGIWVSVLWPNPLAYDACFPVAACCSVILYGVKKIKLVPTPYVNSLKQNCWDSVYIFEFLQNKHF